MGDSENLAKLPSLYSVVFVVRIFLAKILSEKKNYCIQSPGNILLLLTQLHVTFETERG